MDPSSPHRSSERPLSRHPPPASYSQSLPPPPTAQPPVQIPFSDPFHTTRDPFFPGSRTRGDSYGMGVRGWPPTQGTNGPAQSPPPPPSNHHSLPSPLNHGLESGLGPSQMSLPFDPSRRRSLGGSPPRYLRAPFDQQQQLPPPPSFGSRNMPPPPSPPQMPPPASSSLHGAPLRGPPATSPFMGVRDLPSFASQRPGTGMSILSMLGGTDDRTANASPHSSVAAPSSGPMATHRLSPGRARSSSMREGLQDPSPHRPMFFAEPRTGTAFHDRGASEPHRDVVSGPAQPPRESVHSFRNFQPHQPESRTALNGVATLGRPSSQPVEPAGPRSVEEMVGPDPQGDAQLGLFRQFGEPIGQPLGYAPGIEEPLRQEQHMHPDGATLQSRKEEVFDGMHLDRDPRHGMLRYQGAPFGTAIREDQAGLFRPSFQHASDVARESIESRAYSDPHHHPPQPSPQGPGMPLFERGRNDFADRPMTFEEHQRMEVAQREQHANRKESDGSVHRALLNISPELGRKGRNTPQPQAIQGAQPRQSGPIKNNSRLNAFGRMFSGLGSGAGSATPGPGYDMNHSPSRRSPSGAPEDADMTRHEGLGNEYNKNSAKAGTRGGRKGGRRSREDTSKGEIEGRGTPDLRGGKRLKSVHHHHHHAHPFRHQHHHEGNEAQPGSFNTIRFPPNSSVPPSSNPAHHHHHHAGAVHVHPAHHHHHHASRSALPPRKTTTFVHSKKLIESVKEQPRKHLGSQLYSTTISLPDGSQSSPGSRVRYNSESRPLPRFETKENCTFTIRVPRWYVATSDVWSPGDDPSPLEVICKTRQIWGTDVYTDDSDVVAAAVHSGWIGGDFGEVNQDLQNLSLQGETMSDFVDWNAPKELLDLPALPRRIPENHDVHITLLLLPPLETYVSTSRHYIRSREWGKQGKGHDGMSFAIHKIEFVDESPGTRFVERGAAGRKKRFVMEEAKRRDAAAGLMAMFASTTGTHGSNREPAHGGLEHGAGVQVGA